MTLPIDSVDIFDFPYHGDPNDHGPGCGHLSRYQTADGRHLCEQCERQRTGWAVCPGIGPEECNRYGPTEPVDIFGDGPIRLCPACADTADFIF